MSASLLNQGNLLPFRLYGEAEVINWYSLDGTGLNGQFVTIETGVGSTGVTNNGTQDPSTSMGGYLQNLGTPSTVGAAYTNVISMRYANNRKVRPCLSGDNQINLIGVTLHTTANTDENGNPLVNLPYDRVLERGFVISGFSVPILTRGVITLKSSMYNGTPLPGYAACVSNTITGGVDVVNPASLTTGFGYQSGGYGAGLVIGKFLSTSGTAFGGYAQLKIVTL